ncbi:MAG: hypothetical protein PVJ86_00125 [Phycisphaerales bacterium]|jgi:hypothetical protein
MSLKKHATKLIKRSEDLTVVMIITVDSDNQTAMTAVVRDPSPEGIELLNRVGALVTGKRPLEAVNKLPI